MSDRAAAQTGPSAPAGPGDARLPAGEAAVEVEGVRVLLGDQPALRGVSLSVRRGSRLALVGPNGAGKSTLLRVIAGLLRPNGGHIRIDGRSLAEDPAHARRAVGLVAHQSMLHPDLTAAENLTTYARLYALDRVHERVAAGLERVGLTGRARSRVSTFSRGMTQRLALARALLHEPAVLLLDEAESGLDVRARDLLFATLGRAASADTSTQAADQTAAPPDGIPASRTAILATHDLGLVAEVADRVVFLNRGRVVGECRTDGRGTLNPAELGERYAEALARRPSVQPIPPATSRAEIAVNIVRQPAGIPG